MMASNIMFDRRVVRGNTYAARILPVEPTTTMSTLKRSTRGSTGVKPQPLGAPEPVEGRRHIDIQTDAYLEELTDIVPEEDATTQTEAFIDRPPTPLFMPQKTGMDAETQIEPGDLFDFDFEVEPILEVLVGKVLEQGLMEVQEEEELAAMRAHQEHFEQIRNAELIATQRMEEAEKRKMQEKERRLAQERQRVERERTVREKVAACAFARGYLNGLVGTVFQHLRDQGVFFDPVEREVQGSFLPALFDQATAHLSREATARHAVHAIVLQAVRMLRDEKQRAEQARLDEERRREEEARRQAELRRKKALREDRLFAVHASWALGEMEPRAIPEEIAAQTRADLEARAAEGAQAATEAQRQEAGSRARAAAAEEARTEGLEEGSDEYEEKVQGAFDAAAESVEEVAAEDVSDAAVVAAVVASDAVPNIRQTLVEAMQAEFPEEAARWLSEDWDPDADEGPPAAEPAEPAE